MFFVWIKWIIYNKTIKYFSTCIMFKLIYFYLIYRLRAWVRF
jgi:hypothetical protein